MATPGPREGSYLGSRATTSQVEEALNHITVHTDILESPPIDEMVEFLNSKESEGLHMVMLDVNMEDCGAYAVDDEERVRGIRRGNFHVADSGMQFVGRRKPNNGCRNAFGVMQEDLGMVCPGVFSWYEE